jgi:hypothetical protein
MTSSDTNGFYPKNDHFSDQRTADPGRVDDSRIPKATDVACLDSSGQKRSWNILSFFFCQFGSSEKVLEDESAAFRAQVRLALRMRSSPLCSAATASADFSPAEGGLSPAAFEPELADSVHAVNLISSMCEKLQGRNPSQVSAGQMGRSSGGKRSNSAHVETRARLGGKQVKKQT